MIGDPSGSSQHFDDETIQDALDDHRDDVRYETLAMAPVIVNTASTSNQPSIIFADYYSAYQWWEADVVVQGNNTTTGAAWIVLTPLASDYIVGRWQFELTPFANGTVPGQYPPVFATGKVYDLNAASADLLEMWAATLTCAYDFSSDGQSFRRSQMSDMKMKLAQSYRRKAKPRLARMVRDDVSPPIDTKKLRLLDSDDIVKGV